MMWIIWVLYITIIFYNVVDTLQTFMLFKCGAVEMNPYLVYLIEFTGTNNIIWVAKGVPILLLGIGLFITHRRNNG